MKINNLTKAFGNNTVFKDFNLEIKDNQVTYIMGKSGIGKTTLFKMIAGLDKDYTGNISFEGSIAYVFQEPRLFPHLSVLNNLKIVNDFPTYDAYEILSTVELGGCENMMPSELSGGMKMRLSIARAIYYNADVILMDEPFVSIDSDTKERIAKSIFDLLKGKTVIVISHDQNEANKYADKIINI